MTGFKSERRRQKPMMERKRRARINKSLEQLKDVIVDSNGGILPRLDKARILELTVDYLQRKTVKGQTGAAEERYKAGYMRCVNEVTSFLHDKVDDGKLTQIVQYLFTLAANIKNVAKVNTRRAPCSTPSQSTASHTTPNVDKSTVTTAARTTVTTTKPMPCDVVFSGRCTSQPVDEELVSSSSAGRDGHCPRVASSSTSSSDRRPLSVITRLPVRLAASDVVDGVKAVLSFPADLSSSKTVTSFQMTSGRVHKQPATIGKEFVTFRPLTKNTSSSESSHYSQHSGQFSDRADSTEIVGSILAQGNDAGRRGKFGRTRRYASVCSSTTSGLSSADVDSSSDDDVISVKRSRLPVQPGVAGKDWNVAEERSRIAGCDISDSDDESSCSDVFYMDCDNSCSSDVEKEGGRESFSNNEQHGRHPAPAETGSCMWRPW